MKVVLQSESQECGLACLVMIATHHGHHLSLLEARQRFSTSLKGVTVGQVAQYAQAIGFSYRALRVDLEELGQLKAPCILHWDMNHFVVFEGMKGKRVVILDPAVGRRILNLSDVSSHFTGVALELTKNASFKSARKAARISLRELLGRVIGLKRAITNILGLALALEVIALLSPQVTQWVVDGALVTGDSDLLLLAVMGGALLLLIDFFLRMARGWIGLRINQQLTLQWTTHLFGHLLRLPWPFFEKRHLGDITARFQSLNAIRQALTNGAITAILDGLVALVTLAMMLLYNPALTAVVLSALALYGGLRGGFYFPLRKASEERIVLSARENSYFLETLRAALPLKLFNSGAQRLSTWQNLLVDVQNRDLETQKIVLLFASLNTLIFGLEGMLLLYFGGHDVLSGDLTLGMLLAFLAYKSQFTSRCSKLIDLGVEIRMLSLHAERIADIALEAPEPEASHEYDVTHLPSSIELRGVSYKYADGEPWVIRNFSLSIAPGQSVAIVGRSGCGKSTLFKMILGLIAPTEGEILIGGVPVSQLGPGVVRDLVGAVMQEDQLMAGSLAENICCFDPTAELSQIEHSARLANIHKAISRMPMGYQTMVSEMGSGLSGGQRQRLMLARALFKKPHILALDEATSNLDLHSEQHVIEALKEMNMTRIIIAHRKETLSFVDRVVTIANGEIVADESL
ncbi:peptidase domain-containing ABC transporter [Pseudomonas sp. 148P]|uniref:Peptidase domain-containing ABC transporter n=1 Tax=Pseudomonas ulcerans TaxID=3115852 RepID=A0ABU7HQM8_9PSED|nr:MULTISPECIES: peptidase domain-containing ABC transporter [unclassified Pseudomonas]MEE1923775.1 peptidase domain-containing ABC transporter [Pseudomonas sp. 147P]MEE1933835.1 peptidase domain-containing ABC transporter [Pseudomonas sp. 148P]